MGGGYMRWLSPIVHGDSMEHTKQLENTVSFVRWILRYESRAYLDKLEATIRSHWQESATQYGWK